MSNSSNGMEIAGVSKFTVIDVSILLLLILTSGFIVTNDIISSVMTIGLWLILAVFLLIGINVLEKSTIIVFGALALCMSISTAVNNESLWTLSIRIFSFFVVLCAVNTWSFLEFKQRYIHVMMILAVASLIGFSLLSCIPGLSNLFVVQNKANYLYSNWIIYVHAKEYSRNMGLFWEPGAFQTFLCLALLFEVLSKHMSIKRILVFTITVITTFSTTGYIAMAIILLLALVNKNTNKNNKKIIAVMILIAIIMALFFWDELLDTSTNSPFGKLVSYANNKNAAEKKVTSTSVRINGIIQPFYAFLSRPIWGFGYEGLNAYTYVYTHNMNTCTFVNWFAVYGIGYGLTMLYCFYRLAKKSTTSFFQLIIVILVLFTITASENYVDNPFFAMLAIYGASYNVGESRYAYCKHQLL